MNRKHIVILFVLIVLVGGIFYWGTKMQKSNIIPLTNISNKVLPTIEKEQNVDPYDKTNPFSGIKINPFE